MRADEGAGREEARRLESENPFVDRDLRRLQQGVRVLPVRPDGGSIIAARDPGTLPPRMRTVESSALNTPSTTAR
jgi:hypothetical protein